MFWSRRFILSLTLSIVMASGVVESPLQAETFAMIGTGEVSQALGPRFAQQGHRIIYGSRNPDRDKVRQLVARTGPEASATTPAEAAREADIVLLAVPWDAIEEVVKGLGDLSGKILLDPTNPRSIAPDGFRDHPNRLSNAEMIQQWAPQAHVIKAFNAMSEVSMIDPLSSGGAVTIPLAGNSAEAKARVATLVQEIGYPSVDVGPIRFAHIVETLYLLRANARKLGNGFNYYFRPE